MNLCVIPARGGSKRIPKKNIKNFFGKPIIAYSIEAAIRSKIFDKIIVSTDDEEIATVALKFGAEVPFIRPKNLSDDFTALSDVIDHALESVKKDGKSFDYICTLYATAPFVKEEYLLKGYKAIKEEDAVNAFSCASMPFPIQRSFKIDSNGRCKMFTPEFYNFRSQDLEDSYQDAGQFYWTNRKKQSDKNSEIFFSEESIPIIIPRYFVQDIDTLEDWKFAEFIFEAQNKLIE